MERDRERWTENAKELERGWQSKGRLNNGPIARKGWNVPNIMSENFTTWQICTFLSKHKNYHRILVCYSFMYVYYWS